MSVPPVRMATIPNVSILDISERRATASVGTAAGPSRERSAKQKFEAFFLQATLEQALPKNAGAVYGAGFAGDVMRSMLAERIAAEVSKREDFSLGVNIFSGAGQANAMAAQPAQSARSGLIQRHEAGDGGSDNGAG